MKNYYSQFDKKINEIKKSLEETKVFIHKMQTDIEFVENKRLAQKEKEQMQEKKGEEESSPSLQPGGIAE